MSHHMTIQHLPNDHIHATEHQPGMTHTPIHGGVNGNYNHHDSTGFHGNFQLKPNAHINGGVTFSTHCDTTIGVHGGFTW